VVSDRVRVCSEVSGTVMLSVPLTGDGRYIEVRLRLEEIVG
jgi:hypothetical protein